MSGYKQTFSHDQLRSLDIAARVSSCLSVCGSCFTIISFSCYPPLRKPVNRLAFSIAIANLLACLAYSWGQHPIHSGRNSGWCQTQAFFINWFVMTDPILVMIMAFNVFLTVRTKRNATELKKIDVYAILLAFILPFIPSLVFLCWKPNGIPLYGPATLWCWIGKEKDILRLVAFYVPVWCFILISVFLFALSGKQILLVRKNVRAAKAGGAFQEEEPPPAGIVAQVDRRVSNFAGALTSAYMTREFPHPMTLSSTNEQPGPHASAEFKGLEPLVPIYSHETLDLEPRTAPSYATQYSSSNNEPLLLVLSNPWHPDSPTVALDRSASDQTMLQTGEQDRQHQSRRSHSRFDSIHWQYARFAFLCTIVLFITWVPISVNRVYNNFIAPNHQIYALYLTSAASIPLHGFGNFVIYVITSWHEVKEFVTCAKGRKSESRRGSVSRVERKGGILKMWRNWVGYGKWFRKTGRGGEEGGSGGGGGGGENNTSGEGLGGETREIQPG